MTEDQENRVLTMLDAYEAGKRIPDLDVAAGDVTDMEMEVYGPDGETHRMTVADAVDAASNPIAGRWWDEDNSTPVAAGYYGSLQALRDLPSKLGLGRYLVQDDRTRRKLHPLDSTLYEDGSPAALDGTEGQCMWCWNAHYFTTWKEGSKTIMAISFAPIPNRNSVYVPAGGISWIGAGVMDRTNLMLCSVISEDEQYRGGDGNAVNVTGEEYRAAEDSPQNTMLGMPASYISTTNFGTYARKRGEGWEANWFVARAVVEYLEEIIMGTRNLLSEYNAEKDDDGLYQGGFGEGVTGFNYWDEYNWYYPIIPTKTGLEMGDSCGLVDCALPTADGSDLKTFKVPCFFGLMNAGYGHLWTQVRGITISHTKGEKSEVYVAPSLYDGYDPDSVDGMVKVAECPQKSGYIVSKSYEGLCCIPTAVGGSGTTYFSAYFYGTSSVTGLRVRLAGGDADYSSADAGPSCSNVTGPAANTSAHWSAPLYFAE